MFGWAFGPPPDDDQFPGLPPRNVSRWILAPVVIALLLCMGMSAAFPHSWYPWECCSEMDCYPVPMARNEFERTPEGWRLKKEGVVIPFDAARVSPDRQFHICRDELGKGKIIIPSGKPPCLWVPEIEG